MHFCTEMYGICSTEGPKTAHLTMEVDLEVHRFHITKETLFAKAEPLQSLVKTAT